MTFDAFEYAIQALAPTCPHCGNRIIGHGVEKNGTIFCCVHCATKEGVTGLRDRDEVSLPCPAIGCRSAQSLDCLGLSEASERSAEPLSSP
jgi:hypothetical protein